MGGPNTEARSNTEHNFLTYAYNILTYNTLPCYLCPYRRVKHEACSIAPSDDAAGVAVRDVLTFEVRRPPARTDISTWD